MNRGAGKRWALCGGLALACMAGAEGATAFGDRWVYFYGDLADPGVSVKYTNVLAQAEKAGMNGLVLACEAETAYAWDAARKSKYRAALQKAAQAGIEVIPNMWSIGYGSMLSRHPDFVETVPLEDVPYVVRDGKIVFDGANGQGARPITKVPRGAGASFRIVCRRTGKACVEGRDYAAPPQMTSVPVKPEDPPLAFEALRGGMLKEGDRLLVTGAMPSMAEMFDYSPYGQYSACMSDPALYAYFEKSAAGVEEVFRPRKWMLSMDEVRNGGTCNACRARKTDMAHLFADCVKRQIEIIRRVHPKAEIYMWSDMCDPNHNAHDNYYSCKGTFEGSWTLVPKDIVMVCWDQDIFAASMAFFEKQGFRTLLSACCDGEKGAEIARRGIAVCRDTRHAVGAMYTTWQEDHGKLPEFGRLLRAADKDPKKGGCSK